MGLPYLADTSTFFPTHTRTQLETTRCHFLSALSSASSRQSELASLGARTRAEALSLRARVALTSERLADVRRKTEKVALGRIKQEQKLCFY